MSPSDELAVLQLLRLKGRATARALAESLSRAQDDVESVLEAAVDAGQVKPGVAARLTPEGRERLRALLTVERGMVDHEALGARYKDFEPFNTRLKSVVTAWQLTDGGEPNDHQDAAYDGSVIDQLGTVHDDFTSLLAQLVNLAPRLSTYPERFTAAIEQVQAGEHRFVAAPIIDSYHTLWFELHEDLMALLGLVRAEEAIAGRAE